MTNRRAGRARTVVLAAHGSLLDAASAAPTFAHAGALRERGYDVRTAFWKEQPTLRRVLDTVADAATVVPLLTSEGYFADQVFPRELGLTESGVDDGRNAAVDYLDPVGTHPSMRDVLFGLAADAIEAVDSAASEVGVALLGHGSERVEGSGGVTRRHAQRLGERDRFASVEAVFLDQEPNVADVFEYVDAETVVVVPFFIAEGHHVTHDVPAAIGLPDDYEPGDGFATVENRRVALTHAAGTDSRVVDVILDRLAAAGVHPDRSPSRENPTPEANAAFREWVQQADGGETAKRFGDLSVDVQDTDGEQRYELRHVADVDTPVETLESLAGPAAVRDRTRFDDEGRFRSLRSERSLPTGWRLAGLDGEELVAAVHAVYPASVAHWYQKREGELTVTGFPAAADRHTGIYADLADTPVVERDAAVEACCDNCVKRREWGGESADTDAGEIPCPEPCPALLEAVREGVGDDDAESIGEVVA